MSLQIAYILKKGICICISNNLLLFLVINFLVRDFILFEFQVMILS